MAMTSEDPAIPREPIASYATDFTFRILQIVTTGPRICPMA